MQSTQSRSRSSVEPHNNVEGGRMQSADVTHAATPPSGPSWGTSTGQGRQADPTRKQGTRSSARIEGRFA